MVIWAVPPPGVILVLVGLAMGGFGIFVYCSSPRKFLFYRDSMVLVYGRSRTRTIPYSRISDVQLATRRDASPNRLPFGWSDSRVVHISMRYGSEEFVVHNPAGFRHTLRGLLERYRSEQTGGEEGRNAT